MHVIIAAATILLAQTYAGAQTDPVTGSQPGSRKGQVVVPERPTAVDANVGGPAEVDPPKTTALPSEVNARIEQFKNDARAYLQAQDEIKKKMQGANEQDRAVLRAQLKVLREKWLERSREIRQEYRQRRLELEEKLKDHRELFDDLRNSAAERRQKAGDHRRRGGE